MKQSFLARSILTVFLLMGGLGHSFSQPLMKAPISAKEKLHQIVHDLVMSSDFPPPLAMDRDLLEETLQSYLRAELPKRVVTVPALMSVIYDEGGMKEFTHAISRKVASQMYKEAPQAALTHYLNALDRTADTTQSSLNFMSFYKKIKPVALRYTRQERPLLKKYLEGKITPKTYYSKILPLQDELSDDYKRLREKYGLIKVPEITDPVFFGRQFSFTLQDNSAFSLAKLQMKIQDYLRNSVLPLARFSKALEKRIAEAGGPDRFIEVKTKEVLSRILAKKYAIQLSTYLKALGPRADVEEEKRNFRAYYEELSPVAAELNSISDNLESQYKEGAISKATYNRGIEALIQSGEQQVNALRQKYNLLIVQYLTTV